MSGHLKLQCLVCDGLLGPLDPGTVKHTLCAWMRPDDWKALMPYIKRDLQGVQASGG